MVSVLLRIVFVFCLMMLGCGFLIDSGRYFRYDMWLFVLMSVVCVLDVFLLIVRMVFWDLVIVVFFWWWVLGRLMWCGCCCWSVVCWVCCWDWWWCGLDFSGLWSRLCWLCMVWLWGLGMCVWGCSVYEIVERLVGWVLCWLSWVFWWCCLYLCVICCEMIVMIGFCCLCWGWLSGIGWIVMVWLLIVIVVCVYEIIWV